MNGFEMLDFTRAAIKAAGTPDSTAVLTERRTASVRFGQNSITQNMDVFTRELTLTVGDGEKQASVTSQRIDRDALGSIASEARSLLERAVPDPEYMPPVQGGQVYEDIPEAWDEHTAGCPAGERMDAVGRVMDQASGRGYQASGTCTMSSSGVSVSTSTGNDAFHRFTGAELSFTMDRGLASSYRSLGATAWRDLGVDEAIEKVSGEVAMSVNPSDVPPGEYRIILEPEATFNLLMFLPWMMDARSADEGTTVFSGMEGKRLAGESFTLSSSLHGSKPGIPFDNQGLPARDAVWFDRGVLSSIPCDRYTAEKTGRPALFVPSTLDMKGDSGTVADLVKGVDRGILIRRFWYIRVVDGKTLKLTGMTRDGVFLVENGVIKKPLRDFRWNWRPLELFSSIERTGAPVRKTWGSFPPVVLSPLRYPFTADR